MFCSPFRRLTGSTAPAAGVRSRGIALVEQIVTVAALGVVSAVALPKLVDVQAETDAMALKSFAATASSAMAHNFAACLVAQQQPRAGRCVSVANCQDVAALLYGGLPEGYAVENEALGAPGMESACELVQVAGGARRRFVGLSAGH